MDARFQPLSREGLNPSGMRTGCESVTWASVRGASVETETPAEAGLAGVRNENASRRGWRFQRVYQAWPDRARRSRKVASASAAPLEQGTLGSASTRLERTVQIEAIPNTAAGERTPGACTPDGRCGVRIDDDAVKTQLVETESVEAHGAVRHAGL